MSAKVAESFLIYSTETSRSYYFFRGAFEFADSLSNSLIFYSRLIELGCPVKTMLPWVSTRQTNGIPLIANDFIRLWPWSQPPKVKCYTFCQPLVWTLFFTTSTSSSTLTPTILTLSPQLFFSNMVWLCAIGFWQGPHQVAQTSIKSTWPYLAASSTVPSSKTFLICPKLGNLFPLPSFCSNSISISLFSFSLTSSDNLTIFWKSSAGVSKGN